MIHGPIKPAIIPKRFSVVTVKNITRHNQMVRKFCGEIGSFWSRLRDFALPIEVNKQQTLIFSDKSIETAIGVFSSASQRLNLLGVKTEERGELLNATINQLVCLHEYFVASCIESHCQEINRAEQEVDYEARQRRQFIEKHYAAEPYWQQQRKDTEFANVSDWRNWAVSCLHRKRKLMGEIGQILENLYNQAVAIGNAWTD